MRNSYRKQFYNIFLKKTLREIPVILAVLLLASIISAGVIALLGNLFTEDSTPIRIAYVYDDDNYFLSLGIKVISHDVNCKFVRCDDEDEAREKLEDKEVSAILVLEDDGSNSSLPLSAAKFIYRDNHDFVTEAFSELVDSGLRDYFVLNYSADAIRHSDENVSSDDVYDIEVDLLNFLLGRNSDYERIDFTDTGDTPVLYFYIAGAYGLFILLSASVIVGAFKNDDERFTVFAGRVGINSADSLLARNLPFVYLFSALALVTAAAYQLIYWGEIYVLGILFTVLGTLLFLLPVILIHELIPDRVVSVLVSLLFSVGAMFLSGNIIPLSFLPSGIEKISEFIVTKSAVRLCSQAFWGRENFGTVLISVLWTLGFAAAVAAVTFIRGKSNAEKI